MGDEVHSGVVVAILSLLLLLFLSLVAGSVTTLMQRGKVKMKMGGDDNVAEEDMNQRTSRVHEVNYHFKR
jgi:hypothetical protein